MSLFEDEDLKVTIGGTLKMIRINQIMMGVSISIGVLILAIQNGPKLWHDFQLWRNHGIVCERSSIDGKQTRYGDDCRG